MKSPNNWMGIAGRDFLSTGGGVGLIGMWKALRKWRGWAGSAAPAQDDRGGRPKAASLWCALLKKNEPRSRFYENPTRWRRGCGCPNIWAIFWCSKPCPERRHGHRGERRRHLDAGVRLPPRGIYAAPEGAACVAALEKLLGSGFLKRTDRIVHLQNRLRLEISGGLVGAVPR